ncbi:MAG TPA: DUF4440 domain-containing protein [Thioalkalivibrio sp.]|nr:DUF4440 domain-containing protein [Thioalkalivibrio sp.]
MANKPRFATADEAEAVFYGSIEAGDLEMLMQVWADDDGILCIHPGGERLAGRSAIRESWRSILANGRGMRFVLTDEQATGEEGLAVHAVKESITLANDSQGVMLATNVYRRVGDSWRLIMHHASPEPARREADAPPPARGTLH